MATMQEIILAAARAAEEATNLALNEGGTDDTTGPREYVSREDELIAAVAAAEAAADQPPELPPATEAPERSGPTDRLQYRYVKFMDWVPRPDASRDVYRIVCTREPVVKLSDLGITPFPKQARLDADGVPQGEEVQGVGMLGPVLPYMPPFEGDDEEGEEEDEEEEDEEPAVYHVCRILTDVEVFCEEVEGKEVCGVVVPEEEGEEGDPPAGSRKGRGARRGGAPNTSSMRRPRRTTSAPRPPRTSAPRAGFSNASCGENFVPTTADQYLMLAMVPINDGFEAAFVTEKPTASTTAETRMQEWMVGADSEEEEAEERLAEEIRASMADETGVPSSTTRTPLTTSQLYTRIGVILGLAALLLLGVFLRRRSNSGPAVRRFFVRPKGA